MTRNYRTHLSPTRSFKEASVGALVVCIAVTVNTGLRCGETAVEPTHKLGDSPKRSDESVKAAPPLASPTAGVWGETELLFYCWCFWQVLMHFPLHPRLSVAL